MPTMLTRVARSLMVTDRFANPLHILRKRMFAGSKDIMTIVDKASKVSCLCNVGSYHMFGETWYSHVYDVPGVPIRPNDIVLDIGANQGFFTCYAASKGATVYAFEPVPALYERLIRNVAKNGFAQQVTAIPCAVSDYSGTAEMMVSDSYGGGQSTINQEFAKQFDLLKGQHITVECMTLPQVLAEYDIPAVRLCKIDIEGAELRLLSTLKPQHLDRIQGFAMEYHPGAYDLRSLIQILLGWGTHQVSLMEARPYNGDVLHLISTKALESVFETQTEQWTVEMTA
jgi:FkbM family methyltransferase